MSHLSIEVNSGEHSCLQNREHFLTLVLNSSHLLKDFYTDPWRSAIQLPALAEDQFCFPHKVKKPLQQPTNQSPPPTPPPAHIHVTIFSGIPGYLAPWFVQPGNRLFVVLSQTTCGGNKGGSTAGRSCSVCRKREGLGIYFKSLPTRQEQSCLCGET